MSIDLLSPHVDRGARRREKSRNAARCRRQQETDTYNEICKVTPVPEKILSQMDRSSVMRLLISFMKLRKIAGLVSNDLKNVEDEVSNHVPSINEYVNALNGFVIVMSHEHDLLYISQNAKQYIGMNSLDLIGQNLFAFTHEGDHAEISRCMKMKSGEGGERKTFFIRMKSTLTASGKNVNFKSAAYKVLKCDGVVYPAAENGQSFIVAYCEPIPHPSNIEMVLDSSTFLSQHSLDMKFTFCDDQSLQQLLGYTQEDMLGKSFYSFCHAMDLKSLDLSMQKLFRLGQVTTDRYRIMSKYGGFVWLISQATVINNPRNQQPSYVVCVHYIVSKVEEPDAILSLDQMNCWKIPDSYVTVKEEMFHDEMTSKQSPEQTTYEEADFMDSTNDIFCNVDIEDFVDADISLNKNQFQISMAQNAPSIGDEGLEINYEELFGLDTADICNNAPSIGDPTWSVNTAASPVGDVRWSPASRPSEGNTDWLSPPPIQEEIMEDLFSDVNVGQMNEGPHVKVSSPIGNVYENSHKFQQSYSPNANQSRMIADPQNCCTKPVQYLFENAAKPKESFSSPQINHSSLANGGYLPSVRQESPPRPGEYQVVRLPKTQYNQCKEQPMANLKRLFTREVPCDRSATSGFVSQNYQRFTHDPMSPPLKKPHLLPVVEMKSPVNRSSAYQGSKKNVPDATKLLLSSKRSDTEKQHTISCLLQAGDDFVGKMVQCSPCRGSDLSRFAVPNQKPRVSGDLPVLSVRDCEVNAPIENGNNLGNFISLDLTG